MTSEESRGYRLGEVLDSRSRKALKRVRYHAVRGKPTSTSPSNPPQSRPVNGTEASAPVPSPSERVPGGLRVYLAAPYPIKSDLEMIAAGLRQEGFEIVARWLSQEYREMENIPVPERGELSLMDYEDVERCDVFVVFSPPLFHHSGTGGRHVELGIALALGKRVILVGDRVNIFHWHPNVQQIDLSKDALFNALEREAARAGETAKEETHGV